MDVAFTFVCLAANQVAVHRELATLPPDHCRQRAFQLLRDHAAAATVEIWRDEAVWEVIARDGVRAIRAEPADPDAQAVAAAGVAQSSRPET